MNSTTKTKATAEAPIDFDAIVDDLAALRRDFATLMDQLRSGTFESLNDAAASKISEVSDRASHLYDRVKAQGERSARTIGHEVEKRPVASLLIAFAVGFIASRLLIR
jgi:ElaB/YqjD/DUF883 family membrane-anchored ribosome-binding protein